MEKTKTILIATGIYPPAIGVPATYSKLLNDELPKFDWAVKVLDFGQVKKYPKLVRHFIYGWQVFSLIPKYRVIYAQDPVSVGLPVCLACWLRGRDFMLKIVGDYAWEQGQQRFGVSEMLDDFVLSKRKYSWSVRLLKRIQTGVADRAEKIIVPSNYLKNIVSQWGIKKEKIEVIYNAFNPKDFQMTRDQARLELGLNQDEKIIISAGRLVPWKGFGTLIDILPEIIKNNPQDKIKLLIVGSGPEKGNLESKIIANNLSDSVKLLGQLDQVSLFKYLKASDLFVLNTSYEGFSHQLLEVMSLGTIALVTNIGGNPELIKNDDQLFKYNDKEQMIKNISTILNLDNEKKIGIIDSQKYVDIEFTKEKMIGKLIKVIS